MANFKEFVSDSSKFTVLICSTKSKTDENGYYPTVKNIVEACKSRKMKCEVVFPEDYFVSDADKSKVVFKKFKDPNKTIELDPRSTVAIIRGSIINTANGQNIYQYLEQSEVFCINSMHSMEVCSNKFFTYRVFKENDIPTPRTFLLTQNEDSIARGLEAIGGKFPVIVKTLNGAEGIGVSIIESEVSLKGVLQTLWTFNAELLIQEYLPIDYDVRTIVMDGKVIASMRRNKLKGDFRTNASLGAEVEKYTLSPEENKVAIEAAKKVGAFYCGVDLFNVKGKVYCVEVNTSPGSNGITKASGINVVDKLLDYVSDRNNWRRSNYREVGYVESIKLFSNGEEVFSGLAKLDTGNGITSSIHATDVEKTDDGKVRFKIGNKKMIMDVERIVTVVKHQRKFEDKRMVVKFDLQMGDMKLKDIEFGLTDRTGAIKEMEPVLLSREVISKLRFSVSPDKKNMLDEEDKKIKFKDYLNEDKPQGASVKRSLE